MSVSDLYSDNIEVSNACRRFYVTRLQAAEVLKERLASSYSGNPGCDNNGGTHDILHPVQSDGQTTKQNSFRVAVAQLRSELASLIDVDLEVMRQLLMLNDQVEELKWQRRQSLASSSTLASPGYDLLDVTESPWSRDNHPNNRWSCEVSTLSSSSHDYMTSYNHDGDCVGLSKYPTPSALSLLRASSQDCFSSVSDVIGSTTNNCVFDTSATDEIASNKMMKLFNNNNSCDQQANSRQSTVNDIGATNKQPSTAEHSSSSSTTSKSNINPVPKQRPATKPKPKLKPKAVTLKDGQMRVSFATAVPKASSESRTVSPSLSPNCGSGPKMLSEPTSPSSPNVKKDGVSSKLHSPKADKMTKLEKKQSAGTESFHEFSTYVEMSI